MSHMYRLEGLCVDVRFLSLGSMDNNVYIISDDKAMFVVDPSCEFRSITEALNGATPDAIIITHAHYDHMGAAASLREATGAPVIASKIDAPDIEHPHDDDAPQIRPCKVDRTVCEGDVVALGDMKWQVIETPGHTKGSISLFNEAPNGNHPDGLPVLIAGDTLFEGTVGRTDFEGGSMKDMRSSINKLAKLPNDTVVLTGHSNLTTIGDERGRVFARFGANGDDR